MDIQICTPAGTLTHSEASSNNVYLSAGALETAFKRCEAIALVPRFRALTSGCVRWQTHPTAIPNTELSYKILAAICYLCGAGVRTMPLIATAGSFASSMHMYVSESEAEWLKGMEKNGYVIFHPSSVTTLGEYCIAARSSGPYTLYPYRILMHQEKRERTAYFPVVIRGNTSGDVLVRPAALTIQKVVSDVKLSHDKLLAATSGLLKFMNDIIEDDGDSYHLSVQLPPEAGSISHIEGDSWGLAAAVLCAGAHCPTKQLMFTGSIDERVGAVGDIDLKAEYSFRSRATLILPGLIPTTAAGLYASLQQYGCGCFPSCRLRHGEESNIVAVMTVREALVVADML